MVALRRLVAILLLAVFGLPLVSSSLALGQDTDAGLPACCRRTGRHHCAMATAPGEMAARAETPGTPEENRWQIPAERCPYCPAAVTRAHVDPFALPAGVELQMHAQGPAMRVRQAESQARIARDGARQKRGPPVISYA